MGGSAEGGSPRGRRRGCFGSIVSGGCGCTAFLIGAALAIAVAAPQLLSGWGAVLIERYLEGQLAADVEVYDLELHWSQPQRARRVTIDTPAGERVAEFALRLPSLFELLEESSTEWLFRVTDAQLTVRVAEDGTSDLGRILGMEPESTRAELEYLASLLARDYEGAGRGNELRSVRTSIHIREARYMDLASGAGAARREAVLSNAVLIAKRNRVGFQLELESATLAGDGMAAEANATMSLNFGPHFSGAATSGVISQTGSRREAWRLRNAELQLDPVPLEVLRLIGAVAREGSGSGSGSASANSSTSGLGVERGARLGGVALRSEGSYGSMASVLVGSIGAFLRDGAAIEASYAPSERASAESLAGPLAGPSWDVSLRAKSSVGEISLTARHQGDELVGFSAVGEENALSAGFRLAPGVLSESLRALAPESSVEFRNERPAAQWFLLSRAFRVPLDRSALTPGGFFGRLAPRRGEAMRAGLVRTQRAGMRRTMAQALRGTDGVFTLRSRGASAARVAILPADPAKQTGYDRLDWTHRLTELRFSGAMGGGIRSLWSVDQSKREQAEIAVSFPAVGLTGGEDLSPRMDLRLPGLSLSLLRSLVPMPDDLAVLLPRRFDHLILRGLRLPDLGSRGGLSSNPTQGARPIQVSALLDGADLINGVVRNGVFLIPKANVSIPLDQMGCDRVIRAYMPWLDEVRPGESSRRPDAFQREERSIDIEMTNLSIELIEGEFRQSGEVVLRASPLRIKLHPELVRELSSGDDGSEDGWIAWTPAPTRLSMESTRVVYDRIELPLSDDYVPTLDGDFDRKRRTFTLKGLVESSFIMGAEDEDALRQVVISGEEADGRNEVIVTFRRGTINPDITELMQKAKELGDK